MDNYTSMNSDRNGIGRVSMHSKMFTNWECSWSGKITASRLCNERIILTCTWVHPGSIFFLFSKFRPFGKWTYNFSNQESHLEYGIIKMIPWATRTYCASWGLGVCICFLMPSLWQTPHNFQDYCKKGSKNVTTCNGQTSMAFVNWIEFGIT